MTITFDFKNSQITTEEYGKIEEKLVSEIALLNKELTEEYSNDRASINLSVDKDILKQSKDAVSKVKDAKTIVVVGIGGSNLGTIAIYEALKGKLYNETQDKKVYFADTVDSNALSDIRNLIDKEIKNGGKVVLNVISKSGGTTETIANFNVLFDVIKTQENYKDYIILTTEKDSKFWKYGEEKGYTLLDIPKKVGGRYSVFSNVGIFPLTFLGVDTKQLFKGASDFRSQIKELKNPAIQSAVNIYYHSKNGKNIFNTFLFSTQLESTGKWYRQLMGESIGKEFDKQGEKVNSGITPTTAIGSTDLHSMAQLYLGGPNDKFHAFVEVETVPEIKLENDMLIGMKGKTLSSIMGAILKGVQGAFKQKTIPFYEIKMDEINEYNLGYLFQMKMVEMILLGALANVNPFDQPNVEDYKVITKELLKQ